MSRTIRSISSSAPPAKFEGKKYREYILPLVSLSLVWNLLTLGSEIQDILSSWESEINHVLFLYQS